MPYFFKISDYFHDSGFDHEWKDAVNFTAGFVGYECKERTFGDGKAQGILFIPDNSENIIDHVLKFEYISDDTIRFEHYTLIDFELNEKNNDDFFKKIRKFIKKNPKYKDYYLHMTCKSFIDAILANGFLQNPPQTLLNYSPPSPPTKRIKTVIGPSNPESYNSLSLKNPDADMFVDDEGIGLSQLSQNSLGMSSPLSQNSLGMSSPLSQSSLGKEKKRRGGKLHKRKTSKRKTRKRKTSKRKTSKRKTSKRNVGINESDKL